MKNEKLHEEELELARDCDAQAAHDQAILDEGNAHEGYLDHVEIRRNWNMYLADNARGRAEYWS